VPDCIDDWGIRVADQGVPVAGIDVSVPHSARIWNYWLGGSDNFLVDRVAGDRYREAYPQIVDVARAGRLFLGRAVRFLAGEAGVRQFLDVGSGLPAADNTHEVAQRAAAGCRVVYVDSDPLVGVHARGLLASAPEGSCDYVDGDMRDPAAVLAAATRTLDLTQPVAVLFIGVLGHIADYDESRAIVAAMLDVLPAGSYLALRESVGGQARKKADEQYEQTGAVPYASRTPEQVAGYFAGLDLVPPGVVPVADWRPDPSPFPPPQVDSLAGVGRKGA
jgi:S-adenosyl methyltransferase